MANFLQWCNNVRRKLWNHAEHVHSMRLPFTAVDSQTQLCGFVGVAIVLHASMHGDDRELIAVGSAHAMKAQVTVHPFRLPGRRWTL